MGHFVKRDDAAPPGFYAVEAVGLYWLAEAQPAGGVPVPVPVEPVDVGAKRIVLPRLVAAQAESSAAETFGRRLAATHASGASWFGCPPGDWPGDGFIGPIPLPHNASRELAFGSFYARCRIEPFARAALDASALTSDGARVVSRVCERLEDGDQALTGPVEPVARLHGDLWNGNVMWTPDGVVLIDPAAHGGHRETDLAMLALFGLPHLETVLAAYHEALPLADGWRDRVGVHQLFPLLVHAVLFGERYGSRAAATARRYAGRA